MSRTSAGPAWHVERMKRLLSEHPEVRAMMGPNPWSALAIVGLVALEFWLAVRVAERSWWELVLVAYALGAVVAHALGVLIHEAAHDLIFRSANANRLVAILANTPLIFPAAMDFRVQHLKHHAHLGEPDGADTQAPRPWDFEFVTSRWRAFVWHLIGPVMTQRELAARAPTMSKWLVLNVVVNVAAASGFTAVFGFKALAFLVIAGVSAFGHHPVGARRYGEHLTLREGQPTVSYYGKLNWLSFDVGFHVEHHDLPSVPWNHLRDVHALAPELYTPLAHLRSWTALLWRLMARRGEGPAKYFLERHPPDDHSGHAA